MKPSFDDGRVDVPALLRALSIEVLERDGQKLLARCPSHDDRKPSWSIIDAPGSEKNGIHGCWACGFSGRAVGLVQHKLGFATWTVAQEYIEERAWRAGYPGFQVDSELTGSAYDLELITPLGVVHTDFDKWPERPRAYAESRGLTADQVRRWSIGYAIDGRLAGRIYIPTHGAGGRLVSYTGRTFVNAEPRYLNAMGAGGSLTLFGERFWPRVTRRDRVIVTEGAMSALAVERACPTAPLGGLNGASNLGAEIVGKIASFKQVILALDSDPAGETAVDALVEQLVRYADVRRLQLPLHNDPASVDAGWLASEIARITA